MASTSVDGTMYNVAPIGVNALLPPTVLTTVTGVTVGNGATTIVTSPTLPPGTYLVGGSASISASTTFTNTDTLVMRIRDGAGSLVVYPQVITTGYSQIGNAPAAVASTPYGVIVLPVSGTIIWDVNCAFGNAAGKTASVGNPFYERIS
jgi:hypothetical protein